MEDEQRLRNIIREEISAACLFFRSQDILSLADIARNLKRTSRTIRTRLRALNLYKEHGNYSPADQQQVADSFKQPRRTLNSFCTRKQKVSI